MRALFPAFYVCDPLEVTPCHGQRQCSFRSLVMWLFVWQCNCRSYIRKGMSSFTLVYIRMSSSEKDKESNFSIENGKNSIPFHFASILITVDGPSSSPIITGFTALSILITINFRESQSSSTRILHPWHPSVSERARWWRTIRCSFLGSDDQKASSYIDEGRSYRFWKRSGFDM